MAVVYIDTEYTDGNLYVGDFIEIAAISEPSGNAFHTLVKVVGEVPKGVTELTGLTTHRVNKEGMDAATALEALDDFLHMEQDNNQHPMTVIAHGGTNSDFPMLLANCIKNQTTLSSFRDAIFLDTVTLFRKAGIQRPGLTSLCERYGIKTEHRHSAYWDAFALKTICELNPSIVFSGRYQMSYDHIMNITQRKMPVHPNVITSISRHVCINQLVKILDELAEDGASLAYRTTLKVARYFNSRARGW